MLLLPDCTPFQTALFCHKLSLLLLKALYSPTIFREPKTYFLTFLCKCNTHHCSSRDCTGCFSRQDVLQAGCFGKLLSSKDWVTAMLYVAPGGSLAPWSEGQEGALGCLEQAALPLPTTSGSIHTLSIRSVTNLLPVRVWRLCGWPSLPLPVEDARVVTPQQNLQWRLSQDIW